jgi:histidyl-tRNA synthetase
LIRREKESRPVKYSALKGVHDILPPDIYLWQKVESLAQEVFSLYGFQEIRLPIIESTDIFTRSIGETTDIVEKEMYTFPDRAGRSITLRPEGTASVVRAYVENHLYNLPSPQKFFYSGPMFRYERPQKGRFRQFYQIGIEAFGLAAPELDAEILSMLKVFLERLGVRGLNFKINSIGCEDCRPPFRMALVDFFSDKLNDLCPDCQRRYGYNPLRILDCKVERCIELRKGAPRVTDFLCEECRSHFASVLSSLRILDIPHEASPTLIRGLDYYTRTTFEVESEQLGSQKAVAAGGRYDRLVEEFGGPKTPAIGFAIGMERLTTLLKESGGILTPSPDIFIATIGKGAITEGALIAERLRAKDLWTEVGYDGSSLKSQLRKADRLASRFAFIIGDDEISTGKIKWKNLRDGSHGEADMSGLEDFVSSHLFDAKTR